MSEVLDNFIDYENHWVVDFDFFQKYETKVKSPIISLKSENQNTNWQLWMTRKRDRCSSEGYLNLYIKNLDDFDIKAQVTISVFNTRNRVYAKYCIPNHLFTNSEKNAEVLNKYYYFLIRNGRMEILKNNKIRIEFKINIDHCQKLLPCTDKEKFCRLKHLDKFEDLFMNQESSDIVVKADEEEFYVHKIILETFSPVFKAMFQHDFLEATKNKVEIVDIEPKVLKEFLRFIYTGKVNDIDKIVKELFYAAEKYSVQGLKILCENYMSEKMSLEKAIEYLELALKCNAVNLKNNAIRFIGSHSNQLWKKKELKSLGILNPEILYEIMTSQLD